MTSVESRSVSFRKSPDEIDYGAEVKLRNNGSRRLQQAIPNPYSNSELHQLNIRVGCDMYMSCDYRYYSTHVCMHVCMCVCVRVYGCVACECVVRDCVLWYIIHNSEAVVQLVACRC